MHDARQRLLALFLISGLTVSLLDQPSWAAEQDLAVKDERRDAHRALDITKVEVAHSKRGVKITVNVRDYAHIDSDAKVATQLGVHFNTKGNRKPDHLMRQDGFHWAAGSTRDWNELRPNGMDPWGDWLDCHPDNWDKPLIRARPVKDAVVFNAPRTCLGKPDSIRVAVQSYKPYRGKATPDWAMGKKQYLPEVQLD